VSIRIRRSKVAHVVQDREGEEDEDEDEFAPEPEPAPSKKRRIEQLAHDHDGPANTGNIDSKRARV
jgi:hypothetical protein